MDIETGTCNHAWETMDDGSEQCFEWDATVAGTCKPSGGDRMTIREINRYWIRHIDKRGNATPWYKTKAKTAQGAKSIASKYWVRSAGTEIQLGSHSLLSGALVVTSAKPAWRSRWLTVVQKVG